ncbi:similar to Saccharomyces cerevisiae YGL085W LCL3 Putative protein of unknown function [Maudiozyma barnettii]|uniref:Probable endonuclease LCL3 n=1 Tax=Maudiozyma barnettii TaxID=61262 RepID=A0A8H2VET9_9SACH|nr:Lcl3p [Kazachstania barnettii]CAB4254276.1 similar to Saccharomyces cerevisiae YGL085W LCL3 Putative protein of unknown function [Kazachstania barnettii]CAD1782063.1 similar to Saccharomyces cerevisiae YGL085W LCL3 Putative protein of unknown function [Kazachstania barnettii]
MNNDKQSKGLNVSSDVVVGSIILTSLLFGTKNGYSRFLKQYRDARDIPSRAFKRRWLYGKVTAVGDGDNFRFYHTPGGILGGWGTFRRIPQLDKNTIGFTSKSTYNSRNPTSSSFLNRLFIYRKKKVKDISKYYMSLEVPYKGKRNVPTISVRLSGIDAPERAHFGGETQPFGDEALNWLRYVILGKRIWIKPLSIDQYNRCVARAVYWNWYSGWTDVSLQMLKEGLATVYEAKTGAQFDGRESVYRLNEFISKSKSRGLWAQKKVETPGQYKKRQKS